MLSKILDLQCRYYVMTYHDIKFHNITAPIRICRLDYGNLKVCTASRDSLLGEQVKVVADVNQTDVLKKLAYLVSEPFL